MTDAGIRVTVYGRADYGTPPRSVSASLDVAAPPELAALLQSLLDANRDAIEEATYAGAVDSYQAMRREQARTASGNGLRGDAALVKE